MHDDEAISITIAGRTHTDWTRYSLDSDFFPPADAWQMTLGVRAGKLPAYVRTWAEVEVFCGCHPVLTGRIDSRAWRTARGEHQLDLAGRDRAGVLLDCSAPIMSQREVTVEDVCTSILRPLGVDRINVHRRSDPYQRVTIEPGMTAWDALQRAAEASGIWPWFDPDGTLQVGAPDYSRPVDAALILRMDGNANNIIDLSVEESCNRRYSEATVLGQSIGGEDGESDHHINHTLKDPRAWFYRPLIRNEGHVDNTEMARRRAWKIMTDGMMDSLTVTARVRGHCTDAGEPWTPGMHVRLIWDDLQCDASLLLTKRTFRGGRSEGTTTTLTLKPWDTWLPDVKPQKKKKKKKRAADGDVNFD